MKSLNYHYISYCNYLSPNPDCVLLVEAQNKKKAEVWLKGGKKDVRSKMKETLILEVHVTTE